MFDFISMIGNYDERLVDRLEDGDLIISTVFVTDGTHPYETGIAHPEYNDGKFVIVEAYDDKVLAQKGHDQWVKLMTSDSLPDELIDCANAGIAN